MGIDPNELLIFKKRHMTFGNTVANAAENEEKAESYTEKDLPDVYREHLAGQYNAHELPMEEPKAPEPHFKEKPSQQPKKALELTHYQGAAIAPPEQQQILQPQPSATASVSPGAGPQREEARHSVAQSVAVVKKLRKRPFTPSEKRSIKEAKNRKCTIHPWRKAYAACAYCRRPFCYADLIDSSGALYCMEDIDKVSREPKKPRIMFNAYSYFASLFAVAYSTLLLYYTYPQLVYIVNYARAVGPTSFLFNLSSSYYVSLVNLILATIGYISAILMMSTSTPLFASSSIFVGSALLVLGYEYFSTNAAYLFIVNVAGFATLCSMAISRMVSSLNRRIIEETPLNLEKYMVGNY